MFLMLTQWKQLALCISTMVLSGKKYLQMKFPSQKQPTLIWIQLFPISWLVFKSGDKNEMERMSCALAVLI